MFVRFNDDLINLDNIFAIKKDQEDGECPVHLILAYWNQKDFDDEKNGFVLIAEDTRLEIDYWFEKLSIIICENKILLTDVKPPELLEMIAKQEKDL